MSELSDLIIEHGPFVAGQVNPADLATAAQMNELRDELIELRWLKADEPVRPMCGDCQRYRPAEELIRDVTYGCKDGCRDSWRTP